MIDYKSHIKMLLDRKPNWLRTWDESDWVVEKMQCAVILAVRSYEEKNETAARRFLKIANDLAEVRFVTKADRDWLELLL